MDYIDWIISSVVFITVIALVLVAITNALPFSDNSNNTINEGIYSSIVQTIPVYNVSIDNPDGEAYTYSINLDNNYGRAGNTFTIDTDNNVMYGTIYEEDKFYNYETDINSSSGLGALILEENFNDFNYLDTFDLNTGDARVKSGILEIDAGSIIITDNTYSHYVASLNTDANNLKIYLSYTDADNYYYCDFAPTHIQLYLVAGGTPEQLVNYEITDSYYWKKLYWGYNRIDRSTTFFCGMDSIINLAEAGGREFDPGNVTLRIEAVDNNTYIDDFKIYNGLTNEITLTDINAAFTNLSTTVVDNVITPHFLYDSNIVNDISLVFLDNITNYNSDNIRIYKDTNDLTKAIFFPFAKEFWTKAYAIDGGYVLYYPNLSNINNFGTSTINGILKNDLGEGYRIPITFIPDQEITAETTISFDVNFNKAISEIPDMPYDVTPNLPKIYYSIDSGLEEITDFNFNFNPDTNQAQVIAKAYAGSATNEPFNFIIVFNHLNLENVATELAAPISADYSQLTAQSTASITINTNQLYLYNFYNSSYPDINQTIILDVFNESGTQDANCNFAINETIEIYCDQNSIIKSRFRFTDLNNTTLEYPKINITKTKEQILPQEIFENLSEDSYYARIKNKTLDVNLNIGSNPPYKNTIKYLYNNGLLEIANIFIRSYN